MGEGHGRSQKSGTSVSLAFAMNASSQVGEQHMQKPEMAYCRKRELVGKGRAGQIKKEFSGNEGI
jgi:hypothetical protein